MNSLPTRHGSDRDCDDLFWDSARRRLSVAEGEGFRSNLGAVGSGGYLPVAHIPTAPGARTALLVPELGRIYLTVPDREGQRAEMLVFAIDDSDLVMKGGVR